MLKLDRFDINDRKGLEIVILTALLTFQDSNEASHAPPEPSTASNVAGGISGFFGTTRRTSETSQPALSRQISEVEDAPPLPPKPPPRMGFDRVAEVHAIRAAQGEGGANEVQVTEECAIEDYAEYAERLLKVRLHVIPLFTCTLTHCSG